LQRVNVIAVIGLASALSWFTAPSLLAGAGGDRSRELYLESHEQHQGDRQPSNKLYFSHSSWGKVQLHANTAKSSRVGRLKLKCTSDVLVCRCGGMLSAFPSLGGTVLIKASK